MLHLGAPVRHNGQMDAALLSQFLPVLGTLAGALIGGVTAYRAGLVKTRADLEIARHQVNTQLAIAEGQRLIQIAIDRDRQNRQKIEEAYLHLMEWLYEIESTISDIYSGLFSDDAELLVRCMKAIDDWPWETLRAPHYTAATRYMWSERVNNLMAAFGGISVEFVNAAERGYYIHLPEDVMRRCVGPELAERRGQIRENAESGALEEARRAVFNGRRDLLDHLGKVRQAVRSEMIDDKPESPTR
jgi:hypothetical protein